MYLSGEEVKSLKKILNHTLDTEAEDYERYVKEGGDPEKHMYHQANMMMHILNLKSDMPKVKLTGDIDLVKFKRGE